jgi:hypothetical protein
MTTAHNMRWGNSAVGKPEGQRKLGRRGVGGRIILKWILKNERERRGLN